ncbi:hypothetical protein KIPE111705_29280 [Kibdelosporangium persicum]|uniref:WXG100 family type VII secretion target n=1 Tax=Kibdelosporangium persicum TaxID=2698649 RepID=A0ABX2EZU2_9PSEU|nr:hypothetical protein [Kibdelosporangium persicum]NRN64503.1 hypothetical protein [Kibdelosporangium persicum]
MSFRVDPDAVDAMAMMMGRACEAAQLFSAHALTGADNVDEGMLLNTVFDALDKYQALAQFNLERGFTLSGTCSETLAKAAKYYRDTEEATAAAMDRTFPEPIQPPRTFPMQYNPPWRSFIDVYNASEDPRKPGSDYAGTATPTEGSLKVGDGWPVLEIVGALNEITGKISVAQHVRDLLKFATGVDWIGRITEYISGDWVELMRQGMALRDISVAYGRISANVMRGWSDLGPRWGGNAAGTARDWLWDYARNASLFSGFCDQAGVAVQNFARSAYHGMQALDIAVDFLLDALVDVLLKASGASDLIGTAIGMLRGTMPHELLAGVVAGATKVADALDLIEAAVHTLKGVAAFREGNEAVHSMAWPPLEYSHPAVP